MVRHDLGDLGATSFAMHSVAGVLAFDSSFFVHFSSPRWCLSPQGFPCSITEWCLLLLSIGFVLTVELLNSAIETLFRGLDPMTRERSWQALDIAAGAVLMASLFASLVGLLVFGNRIAELLNSP